MFAAVPGGISRSFSRSRRSSRFRPAARPLGCNSNNQKVIEPRALKTLLVILAGLLYPLAVIVTFLAFPDGELSFPSVLAAAALNLSFGFAFKWPSLLVPAVVFLTWYLAVAGNCEDCSDIFWKVGMFALLFVGIGALLRHASTRSRDGHLKPWDTH
jgi:hypothetical protein